MNERINDFFDDLVNLFSMRAARHMGVTDAKVVTSLRAIFSQARGNGLNHDDLDQLIDAETPNRDRVSSKIAWTLSHAIDDSKVWGVNLQLTSTRPSANRLTSPLLNQIERAGVTVCDSNWRRNFEHFKNLRPTWQKTLDAIAISSDRRTVYIAKGTTFSSLQRESRKLAVVGGGANLFTSKENLLENVSADASCLSSLLLARQLVESRFGSEQFTVVPLFVVVDDIDAGWNFEATDLRTLWLRDVPKSGTLCIDSYPKFASSLKFVDDLRIDSDFLNRMPASNVTQPLYLMPPDRRARALMILDVLTAEQREHTREIVPLAPSTIRKLVQERYDIEYPTDMARHDLIACEQGRQLITRMRGMGPRYTMTPVGLARYYWAICKLTTPPENYVDMVMDRIFHHSELAWKARAI